MSATTDVAHGAATLLEADPRLARAVGRHAAASIGHRRVLPVLTVAPGVWTPPAAARLGPGTIALAVLDGLLKRHDKALHGPGDVIVPWDAGWIACTPVRLAVIGSAYLEPLSPWPAVRERLRARLTATPNAVTPEFERLEERLLALLWWIAMRWGTVFGAGLVLPRELDARALSLLLDVEQARVALAVAALRDDGVGVTADGAMWLAGHPDRPRRVPGRRDALRARAAVQLAVARAACEDCAELCEDLDLAVQRRDDLRTHGPRLKSPP